MVLIHNLLTSEIALCMVSQQRTLAIKVLVARSLDASPHSRELTAVCSYVDVPRPLCSLHPGFHIRTIMRRTA